MVCLVERRKCIHNGLFRLRTSYFEVVSCRASCQNVENKENEENSKLTALRTVSISLLYFEKKKLINHLFLFS